MAGRIEGSLAVLVENITHEAETRAKSVSREDPELALDYLDEMADLMQQQAVYLRSVRQEISVRERIRQQDSEAEAEAIDDLRL
jgi:hypothetical protein